MIIRVILIHLKSKHSCGKDVVKRLTRQTETPEVNNTVGGGTYSKLSCYRSADKSLARPGRKQATATKLSLLEATQKKKSEGFPSSQVSAAAMTSASDEKWRPFNFFFSRVGLRTYQHPCINGLCEAVFRSLNSEFCFTNSEYRAG